MVDLGGEWNELMIDYHVYHNRNHSCRAMQRRECNVCHCNGTGAIYGLVLKVRRIIVNDSQQRKKKSLKKKLYIHSQKKL